MVTTSDDSEVLPLGEMEEYTMNEARYMKIANWANHLTAEQESRFRFLSHSTYKKLVRKLQRFDGLLIIVVGMQGAGKTRLRMQLERDLDDAISVKLTDLEAFISRVVARDLSDSEIGQEVANYLKRRYGNRMEWKNLIGQEVDRHGQDVRPIIHWMNNLNMTGAYTKARRSLLAVWPDIEDIENEQKNDIDTENLLIDFQDYDKRKKSEINRDLATIQGIWNNLTSQVRGRKPNIVIFWQEEISKSDGHFFLGKFIEYRIPAHSPEALAGYFELVFDGTEPFTYDALVHIAILARGIWRWFKKYIMECLDHLEMIDGETIDIDTVKEVVTFERLEQDWSRELARMFPKSETNRRLAVRVIRHLQEHGPTRQSTLQERYFDQNAMATSRLLSKLEEYEYVTRTFDGREKLVALKEVN